MFILNDDMYVFALTASTVRHLYLRGGAGVGSMTKIYGSRQRNGVCPAHYSVGSKNVARKVLQALELLKMIEKDPNGWVLILVIIPNIVNVDYNIDYNCLKLIGVCVCVCVAKSSFMVANISYVEFYQLKRLSAICTFPKSVFYSETS